uniref:Uncharacterized protein n=1 Tax=Romanomermis culicivorax TaxID=13658 RepID=A0A915ILA9_ROMCU
MDEPHARCTPLPSTSCTEHGKTPSEHMTRRRQQGAQQKARETTGQTSSTTGATAQPKVMTTKSAGLVQQMPPASGSDSHCSPYKSHHCDDCHRKESRHSPCRDNTTHDSHQHDPRDDAPLHCTQSEQTQQVHTASFYECHYQHVFSRSLPKLTDYVSPLQRDGETQKRLDALKNPPKLEFKARLPPAPPMWCFTLAGCYTLGALPLQELVVLEPHSMT